ncbi:MAG TPA: non-homologous end-joining DNA ligase [Acidiferrobacteraceae bacterium]|nr:non-homologous end-joining DNA ligase [Acidiferrobacteraceae bacterium]
MSVQQVVVGDHILGLSNLDKILYPESGLTKADILAYYQQVAPVLLPHLHERPLTLKRYPDGVNGRFFYEKECPPRRPDWVASTPVWSAHNQRNIHYCLIDDVASLMWAVNLADLELHTFLAPASAPEHPSYVVFDLDPGAPAGLGQCARVAMALKERFDQLGLAAYAKTSGSKGLQIYIPLQGSTDFEHTKAFARRVAEATAHAFPALVVSNMRKSLRRGRVLIDWSQNDAHKTTVCPYSLRAKAQPTVSLPWTWPEVAHAAAHPDAARQMDYRQALARIQQHGDLFAPVLTTIQKLPPLSAVAG